MQNNIYYMYALLNSKEMCDTYKSSCTLKKIMYCLELSLYTNNYMFCNCRRDVQLLHLEAVLSFYKSFHDQ